MIYLTFRGGTRNTLSLYLNMMELSLQNWGFVAFFFDVPSVFGECCVSL